MPFSFLTGGARSGKSVLAQDMLARSGVAVTVIATAEAGDDEMAERIEAHRAGRPAEWEVIEELFDLYRAVTTPDPHRALLIDCLTLWTANRMGDVGLEAEALRVAGELAARPGPAVVISNEVGSGIVPANALARTYRDQLGRVNGVFSAHARDAYLVVAGRVLRLERFDE